MHSSDGRLLKGKTIAVVDNDIAVCDSMCALLKANDIQARTYVSGKRFLQEAPNLACAIIDYHMSGLNGLELASELRKRAATVPIIIITASLDPALGQRASAVGIDQVLRKPFALGVLLDAIRNELA